VILSKIVVCHTHLKVLRAIALMFWTAGGSRLGIALAAARQRGMLGGDYSDCYDGSNAGAASPDMMHSPMREVARLHEGSEDVTPLQSPGGVDGDEMFANFV
jgi:hypothetical protein